MKSSKTRIPTWYEKMYYYCYSENETCSITFTFEMDEAVDPTALRKSLSLALRRYPCFRVTPLLDDKDNVILVDNDRDPVVLNLSIRNWKSSSIGSDESNGYLFRTAYDGKKITVSCFHGIGDGRGCLSFCRTVLYYYLTLLGHTIDSKGMVLTHETPVDATEMEDPMELYADPAPDPGPQIAPYTAYQLPGDRFPLDTPMHTRRFLFSVDAGSLMDETHDGFSTPFSLLSSIIAESIQRNYDIGGKTISVNGAVDMRPYFNNNALSNMANIFDIPFTDSFFKVNTEKRARLIRQVMNRTLTRRHFAAAMFNGLNIFRNMMSGPVTDETVLQNSRKALYDLRNAVGSFMITNIGRTDMPADMSRHILSCELTIPATVYYPVFSVVTHRNRMSVTLVTRTDSDEFAKLFLSSMHRYGIPTEFMEDSYYENDRLSPRDLGRLLFSN
ncbi:MAG: hypothetical protein K5989_01350 [Lachnospiraceae bacterium]|nr:hypothetical protein [Lachnospiraceae bacterium]